MSNTRTKKPIGKKKTNESGKSRANEPQQGKKQAMSSSIKAEAVILAVLAFSVLLVLSVFTESIGTFGGFINKVFFGLFGIGANVLPFAVMLGCIFAGFKRFKNSSKLKNFLICVLFLAFISIVHIMCLKNVNRDFAGPFEYISFFAENGGNDNGGAAGAVIGGALVKVIGATGGYIFLAAVAIICSVIITERSIFELLSSAAVKTAGAARKTAGAAKKINDERRLRQTRAAEKAAVSQKTGESSFEDFKRQVAAGANNYNYKLKWSEADEFENMSYEERAKFVEENPEMFGFSKEAEMAEAAECPIEEVIELNKTDEQHEQDKQPGPDYNLNNDIIFENFDEPKESGFSEEEPPFATEAEADISAIKITDFLKKGLIADSAHTEGMKPSPAGMSNEFIDYVFPPIDLLHKGENGVGRDTKAQMLRNAQKLEETLKSFGVIAKVVQINKGPTVTRYELTPDSGVKVSRIVGLADDIALNLASDGIRIEAPVPGKSVVGIEVPNRDRTPVYLREVLESQEFQSFESKVAFGVGKDIGGSAIVADISDMPHLLIAGATGAGKSVCINTLITSILYKASPNEVKLILIDPKVVELGIYDGIPHLLTPVVTSPKEAASALNWGVHEMNNRYNLFKEENVRDLKGYNNSKAERFEFDGILPKIIIIIDELSDLMMSAPKDVEDSIMRLAQKARAAGIHLVLATQRPSVDVITGVIKANIPSRLAFAVSSGTDSRTILDMVGAEKLLGKGDMLFSPRDLAKPVRVQGAFVSDKEVENIVAFIKEHVEAEYDEQIVAEITTAVKAPVGAAGDDGGDDLYDEVLEFVLTKKEVSVSMLQRQFRIGYNRAARLMDTFEKNGVVSENTAEGTGKPARKVLANYGGD